MTKQKTELCHWRESFSFLRWPLVTPVTVKVQKLKTSWSLTHLIQQRCSLGRPLYLWTHQAAWASSPLKVQQIYLQTISAFFTLTWFPAKTICWTTTIQYFCKNKTSSKQILIWSYKTSPGLSRHCTISRQTQLVWKTFVTKHCQSKSIVFHLRRLQQQSFNS